MGNNGGKKRSVRKNGNKTEKVGRKGKGELNRKRKGGRNSTKERRNSGSVKPNVRGFCLRNKGKGRKVEKKKSQGINSMT